MMDIYACGYNGFKQLDFSKLRLTQSDIYFRDNSDDHVSQQPQSSKPFILLSLRKVLMTENLSILFTWSSCITSIRLPGNECVTLLAGFDANNKTDTDADVCVLENLWCIAAQDDGLLLTESHSSDLLKCFQIKALKAFSVRSDESEASNLHLQQVASSHKHFYTVYNGVNLGKFSMPDSFEGGEKNNTDSPNNSYFGVKIRLIDFVTPISKICCGKEHVLLLSKSGNVYSYGLSSRGQLGHGEIERESSPRLIDALDGLRVETIDAGGWHSAAVSDIGDLYVWGWNESGQLGLNSNNEKGNSHKQEEDSGIVTVPLCIDLPGNDNVKDVACGSRHTVILTETGSVYTCGWNKYGQLGLGDRNNRSQLTKVDIVNCLKIFAGAWNTAFLCQQS